MRKLIITLLMSLLFVTTVSAHECASDVFEQSIIKQYPSYTNDRMIQELFTTNYRNRNVSRMLNFGCQPTVAIYTIPIVVHIVHKGEAIGTGTNLSDAQVIVSVDAMNQHLAPMGIKCVLAQQDPSGNASSGIVRVNGASVPNYSTLGIDPSTNPTGAPDTTIKKLSIWSWQSYLNVWMVSKVTVGGVAYSSMPSAYAYQGVVIQTNTITSVSGPSAFAHEVGHYFGLYHTFQGSSGSTCALNSDPYNQGDKCADTPPVLQTDCSSSSCGTFSNVNNSLLNIMGYCWSPNLIFTTDQHDRIQAALHGQYRWSLVSSPGLIPIDVTTEVSLDSLAFEQDVTQALCNGWLTPKIQVKNFGSTINSMQLVVSVDGVDSTITVFPGFLRGSNNWLTLFPIRFTASGTHNIEVEIRKVNNVADYNVMNNNQCTNIDVIVQTITISATMNTAGAGSVTGSGTFSCNGSPDTIRVTMNVGHVFQYIKEGTTIVSNSPTFPLSIDLSRGNRTFTVYSTVQTFTVSATVNPSNGGTVTGTGTFNYGSTPTVTFKAKAGYQLTSITENGNFITADSSITLTALTANRNLVGNFTLKTFTVSATANPSIGGRVVSGTGTYNYGSNATVVFASKAGYQLTSVTLNGNAIATDSVIQLSALSANAVLVGNFTLKTFTINATVNGVGGSVSGGGQNVTYGTSTTVIATEFSCYTFSGWYENGALVSSSKNYTFTVTGTRNLEARFTQKQFLIVVVANNNALGTVTGGDTYGCGAMVTVRAHVKAGGQFVNFTDNNTGLVVTTDSVYLSQAVGARTLVANFQQVQLAKVSAGSDKTICQGSSVTLTATNSTSYLWNTGQNVPSLTVSPAITTSYIVTGLNGTKDTVVVTVKPLPNVNFSDSIQGSNVQFTAPNGNTTYSWDFGDTQTSQQQNPLHVYTTNGKKYVTLQSTLNGCSNQKTDSVVINNITTGIVNNAAQIDLNIYPNPASNFLKIEIRSLDTYNVEVYNIAGDLLLSNEIVKQLTVDVSLYPKGIYILKLDDGKAIISKQFLVQ